MDYVDGALYNGIFNKSPRFNPYLKKVGITKLSSNYTSRPYTLTMGTMTPKQGYNSVNDVICMDMDRLASKLISAVFTLFS